MKEKPQKASKSSKKEKGKSNELPKEVELTPKQLKEKRREEARAKAMETRKIVTAGIGQWTGKLPAQLLNEHAQKMKWERVEYPVKAFGREPEQQWVASVVLARRNPKTKEIEKVRFDPPADRVEKQPTQVEARHLAATYGMHRVLSHRNMKMMLPPFHRDLWCQLDVDKANAKEHEKYKWNEDPWQAIKDHEVSRQKFQQEMKERNERREHHRIAMEAQWEADEGETKSEESRRNNLDQGGGGSSEPNSRPKRVKFNHTLTMSRKLRALLEQIIRDNNGFKFSTKHALDKSKNPDKYSQLQSMLERLGFDRPFVHEALEYTSTLSAALAWLLIHVPEEDVPKRFMPADIGVTARVSSNMAVENATSKLRSFGYSEDVARSTAEKTHGSVPESTILLTNSFCHSSELPPNDSDISQKEAEESDSMWSEELESLHAMLDERQVTTDVENKSCSISSQASGFRLTVYKSRAYPHSMPGIAIEPYKSTKFSKVVQLEATRRAAEFTKTNLLGDFLIMTLFQHMEDIFDEILKSPVKLAQISSGVFGVDETKRFDDEKDNRSRAESQRRRKRHIRSFDGKRIVEERDNRLNSDEGKKMLASRRSLPAWEKRDEIARLVQQHQVVLITGETGSGKSTQTVQFILDAFPESQIVCTQPRRISAIGVAQRVADERLVAVGDQVGYTIRGEAKMSAKTQLRFVTSGVLLRMLQSGGMGSDTESEDDTIDIDGLTHIFVDEVHERSLDGDFLLILLKRLIQKAPHIKVILMSATVDPKQFFDYFAPLKVGYTHIPGRTFPVKEYFLDTVLRSTGYRPQNMDSNDNGDGDGESVSSIEDASIGKVMGAIRANSPGRIDYNLVGATVQYIHNMLAKSGDTDGSILVFLSGAGEIEQALRAISSTASGKELWPLPLHAGLPPAEQRKVFQRAPRGLRKVVASTNVAETSITISDIVAVVDTGRVKETVYDAEANVSRLVDTWVSQASATQRKGRAGRVRAGECFKLYTENAQSTRMAPRPVPEILRSPLEVLYLNVKSMGISNVEKFLSAAIDPPKSAALDTARKNLITCGALDPQDYELTPLGRHISMVPTDPRTAKLLVLGAMMGCLSRCLTIAAILSTGKLPFIASRDDDGRAKVKELFNGQNGDLLAASEAFAQFRDGAVDRKMVSANTCRDIQSARRQLLSSLIQVGFVDPSVIQGGKERIPEDLVRFDDDLAVVRSVIGAAMQPNTVEVVFPQQKYMSTSAGAVQKEGVDDSRQIRFFTTKGERVFIHPRSLLFGETSFLDSAKYMAYGSAVVTSKHFIADVSPLSTFGLILFASRIGVDPLGNGLIIDKWTGLKCWPRAGILLQFLQQLFGMLMDKKFRDPKANIIDHPVIQLVHDLIESESKPQGVGLLA